MRANMAPRLAVLIYNYKRLCGKSQGFFITFSEQNERQGFPLLLMMEAKKLPRRLAVTSSLRLVSLEKLNKVAVAVEP